MGIEGWERWKTTTLTRLLPSSGVLSYILNLYWNLSLKHSLLHEEGKLEKETILESEGRTEA